MCIGRGNILCVVVHDDSHTVHIETVCLGHHTLSESVGDVIGAKQSNNHDCNLGRNDTENGGVPPFEDSTLKLDVGSLAAWKDTTGVACLADGSFNEGIEVSTAVELILDAKTTLEAKLTGPLRVDLAL